MVTKGGYEGVPEEGYGRPEAVGGEGLWRKKEGGGRMVWGDVVRLSLI
ncbi:hypothetical protein HanPSC8_Chr10g0419151 [Helianthus annuus]|nr:hypothetical protein HanPSC8_Chr10g0419151 [Helianthus annuus]